MSTTSESARLRVNVDLHEHVEPSDSQPSSIPESDADADAESTSAPTPSPRPPEGARLWREDGKVMYRDAGMEKPEAVRLVWARPLSGRNGPASVLMAEKKKEVAYIPDLSSLAEESRRIALEELEESLVMPEIRTIVRVIPRFGNFYWDVETNLGRRKFLLLSPETNTFRPNADAVILRDVSGNCYEISSISSLDASSLREMDRVL